MSDANSKKRKNNQSIISSVMPKKRHNTKSFPPTPGDSTHCVLGCTGKVYLDWSMLALKILMEESFWLDIMTVSTFIFAVRLAHITFRKKLFKLVENISDSK